MAGWKKNGLSGRGADHILCPFFRAHSAREILCESHIPGSKSVLIRFDSEHKKIKQQRIFCECEYRKCEHYLSVKHFMWEDE